MKNTAINFFTKSGKRKTVRAWKPEGSEHENQVAIFKWAALNIKKYPELALLFAVPNGGLRNIRVALKLKAEGVKRGVPDIFLDIPRGIYHGLRIELKAAKNKITPEQDRWIALSREYGYRVDICYGWQAAANVIEKYLAGQE